MIKVTKKMLLTLFILSILFIFTGCPESEDPPEPTPTPIPTAIPEPPAAIEIDFESDTAGTTTYPAMGWGGVFADVGSVVTIASIIAGDGLPANGDSVNVLLVEPTDYNEICIFPITIPAGYTLGDYSTVSVDAYFPRETLGITAEHSNNYYKEFILEADTTLSDGAECLSCMDCFGTDWDDVDVWMTFTFDIDSASTLEGDIEIAVGISRPAINVENDFGYFLDNIVLE